MGYEAAERGATGSALEPLGGRWDAVRERAGSAVVLADVSTRYGASARAFDVALALLVLPLVLPLALLVAIAVVLDSPGPIIYRSVRVGRGGRRFEMFKFRTMRDGASGPSVTQAGDDRHTPVGRLLATMRLDELPQIWNVLRGQMRFVGPRPEVECFVLAQPQAYRRILSVPPGVTGPTQLAYADEGRRLALAADPEAVYREQLLPRKVLLDLDYVEGRKLSGDLTAIARTWLVPGRQLARALDRSAPTSRGRGLAAGRLAVAAMATLGLLATFALQGGAAV